MKPVIVKASNADEFFIDEQCFIKELSNTPDDSEVSIAQARVEPGVVTHWHHLKNTVERYVILSGTGEAEIGELPPQVVSAGDVVLIPAMCRQRIRNVGDVDLVFLAICSPRFTADNYVDLE